MKITVLNDLHLGVNRTGGTTSESAQALREYTHTQLRELLKCAGDSVVINGDMFDSYQVPTLDLLLAYQTISEWAESFDNEPRLWLIPGNHDLAKNSANLSSFELLAMLLTSRYPYIVKYCPGGNWIDEVSGLWAISHVANQDMFDVQLDHVPDTAKTILLHCNYDNPFAGQSDHSLNLSRDAARALTKRGITLVLGHEHQGRTLMNDKVIITGNQFPTSVSDCQAHGDAQKDGRKCMLQIEGEDMELIPTWNANNDVGGYLEAEWENLQDALGSNAGFIRVTGKALAEQSSDVIKAISRFRQQSQAFVITNAVKVELVEGIDISDSVEDIRSVNIMDLLMEQLTEDERAVIRTLLTEAA